MKMRSVAQRRTSYISLHALDNEARRLASEFPDAKAFLQFRMYAMRQRQNRHPLHGGRSVLIQPADARDWPSESEAMVVDAARWCLWSNLFSQVVYTYYRDYYDGTTAAKRLLFPEIIGDCPGACRFHLDPITTVGLLFGLPSDAVALNKELEHFGRDATKWVSVISGGKQGIDKDIAASVVRICRHDESICGDALSR